MRKDRGDVWHKVLVGALGAGNDDSVGELAAEDGELHEEDSSWLSIKDSWIVRGKRSD